MSGRLPLLRLSPWFIFYTHIHKITFKFFLIDTYSLGHEEEKYPDIRFSQKANLDWSKYYFSFICSDLGKFRKLRYFLIWIFQVISLAIGIISVLRDEDLTHTAEPQRDRKWKWPERLYSWAHSKAFFHIL